MHGRSNTENKGQEVMHTRSRMLDSERVYEEEAVSDGLKGNLLGEE